MVTVEPWPPPAPRYDETKRGMSITKSRHGVGNIKYENHVRWVINPHPQASALHASPSDSAYSSHALSLGDVPAAAGLPAAGFGSPVIGPWSVGETGSVHADPVYRSSLLVRPPGRTERRDCGRKFRAWKPVSYR